MRLRMEGTERLSSALLLSGTVSARTPIRECVLSS